MASQRLEQRHNDNVQQSELTETHSNIEKGFHKHADISGLDDAALEVSLNESLLHVILG
jgi:hypothetical protein